MLSEQVKEILLSPPARRNKGIMDKIRNLERLEQQGIIAPTILQTAYKYPLEILPNGIKPGFKTR